MMKLSQQGCRGCGVKLTLFEIQEKDSYCMECFQEMQDKHHPAPSRVTQTDVFVKRKNTRRYAWYYHRKAESTS